MNKKLINGLKYEKLTEEQLYDLSQWELVDIILAYREDLKAKEQECERLKEEIKTNGFGCFNIEMSEQLDQLKAELTRANCQIADDEILQCDMRESLEALKAENEELEKEIAKARMEICNQCGEKDDYNIPCKQIRDLDYGLQLEIEENEKLKQTLTEIKEIAEEVYNNERTKYQASGVCYDILQKISEVEEC